MRFEGEVCVELSVRRNRKVVAAQLVGGLVSGALYGPGLGIERRDAAGFSFSRRLPAWSGLPDSGEVSVGETQRGEVKLSFAARFGGWLTFQALVGLGTLLLGAGAFAFVGPWAVLIYLACGITVFGLMLVLRWRLLRGSVSARIQAFVHNTTYYETP